MFQYQQKFAQGSGSLNPNNNVCATTNSKHGELQEVICILCYEFLLFILKLFYIFFMFNKQYQNSAELLVTNTNNSNICATPKKVRKWHTNPLIILFQYWTKQHHIWNIQKQDSTPSVGNTNFNKYMTSGPYNTAQEQQQVQEIFLCCVLLSLHSSNLHSYSNLLTATEICINLCKCIYKSFMSKWWQTCTYIYFHFDYARNVSLLLIALCIFGFFPFFQRFQITKAYKAVMFVGKNRWDFVFMVFYYLSLSQKYLADIINAQKLSDSFPVKPAASNCNTRGKTTVSTTMLVAL